MSNAEGLITILHTSFVAVDDLTARFKEIAPRVTLRHIVDDSLLDDVLDHGGVTPSVERRLAAYLTAAEELGSDVIFSQCSSVGEAVEAAAKGVSVPVVRIDSRMAELACDAGSRIGVVATLETTLAPTSLLIEKTAGARSQEISIDRVLVEGAFDALRAGDRALHNQKVIDAVRSLAERVDVVVCAQGSMAAIVDELGETRVPVLTSPALGVANAIDVLEERLAERRRAASI